MARIAGKFMSGLVDCLAPAFLLLFFVVSACVILAVITPAANHPDPLVLSMRSSMANQTNQGNQGALQGNPRVSVPHSKPFRRLRRRTIPNPTT
jgi:hypothetical protein